MLRAAAMLAAMGSWALLEAQLPPDVLLLARVKNHMREVLTRQPNYTCLETIERSQRRAKGKRFELVDALHLEVAVVDGKELFSWPGEREFKDRDLRELAPTGAIANGSFAIHARSVFMSIVPHFKYFGVDDLDGRKLQRYDYSVPQFQSGYKIRIGQLEGITGYKGSFWIDEESLDLVRLDVEAFDIPPHLPLKATSDTMLYERVAIGESTFLLPKSSELIMEDFTGARNRNLIRFSRCRQYSGESTLSFADVPEEGVAPASPAALPEAIVLPPDLYLELELATAVKFPGAAIGDPISAVVRRDVRRKGKLFVPKGAELKGNIILLERRKDERGNAVCLVALQWREIAFDGKIGPFEGQLEEGGALPIGGMSNRGVFLRPTAREPGLLRHRDVFYVRKDSLELPRGLPLNWRTLALGAPGAQKQ